MQSLEKLCEANFLNCYNFLTRHSFSLLFFEKSKITYWHLNTRMFGSKKSCWPQGSSSKYGLMAKTPWNRRYYIITKHSVEIPSKFIHIGILVFPKVDLNDINFFFAFSSKARYFGGTFHNFWSEIWTIIGYFLV